MYRLSDEEAERFARLWAQRDPRGRMKLSEAAAFDIIARMPTPLGTADVNAPMPPTSTLIDSQKGKARAGDPTDEQVLQAELLFRRLPLPFSTTPGVVQV